MAANAKETLRLLDAMSVPFLAGRGKKQRRCGGGTSKCRSGARSGAATPRGGGSPRPDEQPPAVPDAADVARLKSCATVSTCAEGGSCFAEEATEGDAGFGEEEREEGLSRASSRKSRPQDPSSRPQSVGALEAAVSQPLPPAQPRSGVPRPGNLQPLRPGSKEPGASRSQPQVPKSTSGAMQVQIGSTGPPPLPSQNARQPWWETSAGPSNTEDMAFEERDLDVEFGSSEWAARSESPQPPSSPHRVVTTPRVPVTKPLQNPMHILGVAAPSAEPPQETPPPSRPRVLRQRTLDEALLTGDGSQPPAKDPLRVMRGLTPEPVYVLEGEELRDELAEVLANKYRNGLESLKEHQAAWRRQHDALVRKKQLATFISKRTLENLEAVEGDEGGGGTSSKPVSRPVSPEGPRPASPAAGGAGRAPSKRLGGRDRLRGLARGAGAGGSPARQPDGGGGTAAGGGEPGTPAAAAAEAREPAAEASAPAELEPPAMGEGPRAEKRMSNAQSALSRAPERRVVIDDPESAALARKPERRLAAPESSTRRGSLASSEAASEAAESRGPQGEAGGQHPEGPDPPHHGPRPTPRRTLRGESMHGVGFLAAMGARSSESSGSPASHAGAAAGHHADRVSSKFEGLSLAPGLLGRKEPRSSDFNCAVNMARKHKLPLEEVRMRRQEFLGYSLNEDGEMPQSEFRDVVRKYCGIESGGEIPAHLLRQHDKAAEEVSFEDFLLWTVVTAWLPERLVSDPEERRLRQIARDNHLCITDVERIKATFDKFDGDSSGYIDEKEFRNLVLMLMNVKNPMDVSGKRLHRYWCEVDTDRSGTIQFEEFLQWYVNLFDG